MKKHLLLLGMLAMTLFSSRAADDIITSTPTGTLHETVYASSDYTFLVTQGMLGYFGDNSGYGSKLVVSDDAIYIHNVISEYPGIDSWIKGTIKDDSTVEFALPQPVATDKSGNVLYAYMLKPVVVGTVTTMVPDTENSALKMTWDGTTLKQILPEASSDIEERYVGMIGLLNGSEEFMAYGESGVSYTIWTETPAEPAEGLQTKDYALSYFNEWNEEGRKLVQIGIDGDVAWIKGLSPYLPQAWVRGTVAADGSVTIPSKQYLGFVNNYFTFFYGASAQGVPTSEPFNWLDEAVLIPYETGYTSDDALMINLGCGRPWFGQGMKNILLTEIVMGDPIPADPEWGEPEWDEGDGMGAADFFIPTIDINGNPLDTENLYYRLYFNGQPVDFGEGDQNNEFKYTEDYDLIFSMFDWHFLIFLEPLQTLGVESVYKYDGREFVSNLVTFSFESDGIAKVASDVISTEYFNLSGIRVANPSGICIRRTVKADGSIETKKVVVR